MPDKTQGQLLREHGEQLVKLDQRVDQFRKDIDRIERDSLEAKNLHQANDKQIALVVRDAERLDKRIDEFLRRRWELSKLLIAALLGALLTKGGDFLLKRLDWPHTIRHDAGESVKP